MGFFDTLLYPFKVVIAWLWVMSHNLFTAVGMNSSWSWVCGIFVITAIVRLIILPLALKSAKSARAMSAMQPEIKRIQEKYKGRTDQKSRMQMNSEMSELYGQYGANPMASCWPMAIQMPVLFALYRVLYNTDPIAHGTWARASLGPLTQSVAQNIEESTFFGAHLSETMTSTGDSHVRMLAIVMVAIYVVLMWLSMGWLAPKNMGSGNAQSAKMMKIMGWTMPVMMAFAGINLQIGVLIYWLVSMFVSLLQQAGIMHWMATPHSPAYEKMMSRHQRKYDRFEADRKEEFYRKLSAWGMTDKEVAEAQVKLGRARAKNDDKQVTRVEEELGVQMVEAVKAREAHHDELRAKRIALELEAAPLKPRDPSKKTFMQKLMESSAAAQERQSRPSGSTQSVRIQANQPKNLSRAEQKRARQKRQAQAQTQKKYSKDELAERQQRRRGSSSGSGKDRGTSTGSSGENSGKRKKGKKRNR